MSKEKDIKFVKIQTCVLKVNIHCEGCKQKVKKLLQKIDGVYTTAIDAEQGKVTVSGNVDPATLIKKLGKSGKHAELWSSPKGTNNNNNNNALNKQLQNVKIDNKGQQVAKSQKSGKDQKSAPNTQTQPQRLLQQFKWLKDMNLPQFKGQKAAKISSPEDEDLGDEFDDCYDDSYDDDDDDDLDDDFDDEFDDEHEELMRAQALKDLKMRAMNSHGHGAGHPFTNVIQAMNDKKGGSVVNSNKNMPIHMKGGQNGGKNGNGGKKEGGNNGGNQNQNQSQIGGQNGPKNGGGNKKNTPKIANAAVGGNNNTAQGGKKGSSPQKDMGQVFQEMNFRSVGGGGDGGVPMSQMGMLPQGHISAVQGLPMNSGGYFQGMGPEVSANNPYHQQYLAAMMMQQQRQNAGERMQPMTYVRPPSAVAYAPYIPQQYHSGGHDDVHYFNDYNTNSCSVM